MKKMILLILICFAIPLSADDKAPLGSEDFFPSPEHPVGWRGDGTGRFPGATPPKTWDRRLADITSQIMVQTSKPDGKPGADSRPLEYFTLKDWLIAGPFSAPDPEKDIENDFLGGEAQVQPSAGDKVGSVKWKVHRAYEGAQGYRNHNEHTSTHLYVDFVYAFGKIDSPEEPDGRLKYAHRYTNLDKQAAYAHTYLFSPDETDVFLDMIHELPAVKMWVNGSPQRIEKGNTRRPFTIKIHLKKGWNRILVKAICNESQKPWRSKYASPGGVLGKIQWRFATYIRPAESGPFSYTTKNIAWMTKLTGRNASQPITVGDRLFVGSSDTDLFCLDKASGKIRWMHTVTYRDAMTDEEYAAVKDKAAPLLEELDKANGEMVLLLNKNISSHGLDTEQQKTIDRKLDERNKLVRSVHRALSEGAKGKLYDNEVSAGNATPASDGKYVYWVVQGTGGYLSTAFDLDGKRVWSSFEFQNSRAEHGSHRSPLLCEGKLIVSTNEQLIAYESATGKELWRTPGPLKSSVDGQPIAVVIEGKRALQTSKNLVSLDGEVLAGRGYPSWGVYVPVVEDGVLYNSCTARHQYRFEGLTIPIQGKSSGNWSLNARTLYGSLVDCTLFYYVASPLYVDGMIYQVDESGILLGIDTSLKKLAYLHWMDGYNYCDRGLYGYCASPTLAGKNIYLMDEVGYTTIIKPGPDCTVINNNMLQNLSNQRGSAPGRQEAFYAGMYFDGSRMFVHSDNYLYCIMEEK